VAFLLACIPLSSCQQLGSISGVGGTDCPDCASKAKVCEKPTVRALAHDLDELEDHIEDSVSRCLPGRGQFIP
jgi:hypothetical protein